MNSSLFEPLKLGALQLPNRIVMAPLTRMRAHEDRTPSEAMIQYYSDRSGAGLIIAEATSVSPMGVGYPKTPGIWSEKHVEGWKPITQAVHKKNGRIFLQLWHVGRVSDPVYLDGKFPVAPSAEAPGGFVSGIRPQKSFVTPRALELSEIPAIVNEFRVAAGNALKAGFDGVEIHGANGYLLDQFLQDGSNKRTDVYGGSIENRARLMLEVVDAVVSVCGAARVGLHLSPRGEAHSMFDSNPLVTFSYVVEQVKKRNIAFIFSREAHDGAGYLGKVLKEKFGGVYIANQNLTQSQAERIVQTREADAVAFGRLFIANPDLPVRFLKNALLNEPDPSTFYSSGEQGYNDYPFYSVH